MAQFVRSARIGVILAGAAALMAGSMAPASAAPASDKEKKVEAGAPSDPQSVRICVEGQAVTGSRIPRPRQCKTRAEWIKTTGIDPLTDR